MISNVDVLKLIIGLPVLIDVVIFMFDVGVMAVVSWMDSTSDIGTSGSIDVSTLRIAAIINIDIDTDMQIDIGTDNIIDPRQPFRIEGTASETT